MRDLTNEILQMLPTYYFKDEDLHPEYWKQLLSRAPQSMMNRFKARPIVVFGNYFDNHRLAYEFEDYCKFSIVSFDDGQESGYDCYISASHQLVMICYKEENKRYGNGDLKHLNINLVKGAIRIAGNLDDNSIILCGHKMRFHDPLSYNIAIILLKWINACVEKGIPPVKTEIRAPKLYISQEKMEMYGLSVDRQERAPLTIGRAELQLLDYNNISPRNSFTHTGHRLQETEERQTILCAYPNRLGSNICSINEASTSLTRSIKIVLIDVLSISRDNREDFSFFSGKNLQLCGDESEKKIYLFNSPDCCGGICIKLFSEKDYYTLAAWLVVAVTKCFSLKDYEAVAEYWPSEPKGVFYRELMHQHEKNGIPEMEKLKEKVADTVKALKPLVTNVMSVLEYYTSLRKEDYNTSHASFESQFKEDCVLLWAKLSTISRPDCVKFSDNEKYFIKELFAIDIDSEAQDYFSKAQNFSLAEPSSTLNSMCYLDVVVAMMVGLNKPIATSIANAYETLGNAYVIIASCSSEAEIEFKKYIQIQKEFAQQLEDAMGKPTGEAVTENKEKKIVSGDSESTKNTHTENDQGLIAAMDELNSMIGLSSIKEDVKNLLGLVKMQKMREARGMKAIPVSLHLVFTGNPGTGKTTVARILSKLYKEIGVLEKGQLVEVDRSDLVAGYIGQTAIKTQEKIKEAKGGILFIDEAYTLAKEGNDFGQEAIDTLLKEMEDHRGEFVVIVAGYSEPMRAFIDSNPGLKSRFNKYFEFPDYSKNELEQIFDVLIGKYEYNIKDDARAAVSATIEEMDRNKGNNFANARDVRNYFERIITRQANRVAMSGDVTNDDLTTITLEDVK